MEKIHGLWQQPACNNFILSILKAQNNVWTALSPSIYPYLPTLRWHRSSLIVLSGFYVPHCWNCGRVGSLSTGKNDRESTEMLFISSCTYSSLCRQTEQEKTDQPGEGFKEKKKLDSSRGETRVNIGVIVQRCRQLMEWKACWTGNELVCSGWGTVLCLCII